MSFLVKIKSLYGKFERPISSISLVFGFIFDALTLKRVDTFWENIWILGHIVLVGLFIVLIHTHEKNIGDEKDSSKKHFWYVNILQFLFGGLLSTYLVFYFRSADIFVTWPFILVLIGAFIANETLKRHYIRFSFQISLFFLSIYSFAIFLVPVILHKIGTLIFLLSGVISIVVIVLFILVLNYFAKDEFKKSKKIIFLLILGISFLINFLYFTNLIPPIPLSLKDAGVYHFIQKNKDGNYNVTYEKKEWMDRLKLYENFNKMPGYPIYAYSAIFSPKKLNISIIHEWEYYDEIQKKWKIDASINLPVVGGRDEGFRTYSIRSNLKYGKWRVNVKTELGQTIGRIRFKILPTDTKPEVLIKIKE